MREKYQWLPLTHTLTWDRNTTHVGALTRDRTHHPSVYRMMLQPTEPAGKGSSAFLGQEKGKGLSLAQQQTSLEILN